MTTSPTALAEGSSPPVAGEARRPTLVINASASPLSQYLRDLRRYGDLVPMLATRDVKLRYRQTALGAIWVVLQPLIGAGILTFVFGRVAGLGSEGVPYFLFSFGGMLAWTVFASTLTRSSGSLVQHAALVSKIFFPRLILPIASVFAVLVDLLVSAGMLTVLMTVEGFGVGWRLVTAPLWIAALLLLALGIGCVLASISVRYRDVGQITPVLVQVLLYLSPVAYAVTEVPERYRRWYRLNPLAPLMEQFRWSLFGTPTAPGRYVLYALAMSLGVFALGAVRLVKAERLFADVV